MMLKVKYFIRSYIIRLFNDLNIIRTMNTQYIKYKSQDRIINITKDLMIDTLITFNK